MPHKPRQGQVTWAAGISSGASRTRSFSSAFEDTNRMLLPSAAAVREAACPVA